MSLWGKLEDNVIGFNQVFQENYNKGDSKGKKTLSDSELFSITEHPNLSLSRKF